MKRYLCAAFAAALLMPSLWAVGARAQEDGAPPPPEQSEHQSGGSPDGGKVPEQMKKRLKLTDEQDTEFKDALKAHGDAIKPYVRQMKDLVKELADQIKSKAPDADIQKSLDALKAARRAMVDEQEKFQDSLDKFLTPTQRAKLAVGAAMRMRREREDRAPKGPRRRDGDDADSDK